MSHVIGTAGNYEVVSSGISMEASVDLGMTQVSLTSGGSLLPATGNMDLFANGTLTAAGGMASLQLATDVAGQSSAVLDGGPAGNVTIGNALPVGNTQQLHMNSLTSSILMANGNIPGTTQSIKLDAKSQSIEISAGGLPISPTIKMTPTGITLSCGPASKIEITAEGISINGAMIDIAAKVQVDIKGNAAVNVSASGQTAIKGAMVMIN